MACFYSAPLAWNPTGVDMRNRIASFEPHLFDQILDRSRGVFNIHDTGPDET